MKKIKEFLQMLGFVMIIYAGAAAVTEQLVEGSLKLTDWIMNKFSKKSEELDEIEDDDI